MPMRNVEGKGILPSRHCVYVDSPPADKDPPGHDLAKLQRDFLTNGFGVSQAEGADAAAKHLVFAFYPLC
jgi:hypothetical protein